jgi:hypothetical protein
LSLNQTRLTARRYCARRPHPSAALPPLFSPTRAGFSSSRLTRPRRGRVFPPAKPLPPPHCWGTHPPLLLVLASSRAPTPFLLRLDSKRCRTPPSLFHMSSGSISYARRLPHYPSTPHPLWPPEDTCPRQNQSCRCSRAPPSGEELSVVPFSQILGCLTFPSSSLSCRSTPLLPPSTGAPPPPRNTAAPVVFAASTPPADSVRYHLVHLDRCVSISMLKLTPPILVSWSRR